MTVLSHSHTLGPPSPPSLLCHTLSLPLSVFSLLFLLSLFPLPPFASFLSFSYLFVAFFSPLLVSLPPLFLIYLLFVVLSLLTFLSFLSSFSPLQQHRLPSSLPLSLSYHLSSFFPLSSSPFSLPCAPHPPLSLKLTAVLIV